MACGALSLRTREATDLVDNHSGRIAVQLTIAADLRLGRCRESAANSETRKDAEETKFDGGVQIAGDGSGTLAAEKPPCRFRIVWAVGGK